MAIGLGLGVSKFPFDDARGYWRWIEQCETGGVDSIWQTDSLISKEPMLECLSTMAALAGATERIRFGMNVASIALRDPLLIAKQCATIDFLSNGRLLPAFGVGSALGQDYKASGAVTKRRGKKANEALALVRQLWDQDDVSFKGEFFQYQNASIAPKPSNQNIPLWIGGSSEVAMRRVATYGTGWLGGLDSPDQAAAMVTGIKQVLLITGRTIQEDHYGASFSFRIGDPNDASAKQAKRALSDRLKKDPSDFMVVGDVSDIHRRIEDYIAAGCSKFVMLPIASNTAEMQEQTRLFISEILPVYSKRI
ncbi:MAG: LLM class flavin-dependent oxidoreductase [Oceanicoccus sp.]